MNWALYPTRDFLIEIIRRSQITTALYGLAGGFGDGASVLLFQTFTGHVTGNLVLMMVAVAHREWRGVIQRLLAMAVFLMATRCGFLLATTRRSNAWLVLTQTVLLLPLLLLHATISHLPILGIALCCAALGLQNGVVTTAGGVNLHSTFVSGDLTKLLKPVSSPAASATSTAPRALLPWLIVGFATGALGAAASLLLRPGLVFFLLLGCFWLAFTVQALTASKRT